MNGCIAFLLWLSTSAAPPEALVFPEEIPSGTGPYVEVRARDSSSVPGESLVLLRGDVNLIYGDFSISADEIRFDWDRLTGLAKGNVRLWYQGNIVYGSRGVVNLRTREATITNAEFDGLGVYARGERLELTQEKDRPVFELFNGEVTTCELPIPHYHVDPSTLKVVSGDAVTTTNAVLRVGGNDIPILWVPYFRRSISGGPFGWKFTPGYSSQKGALALNEIGYAANSYVRPRVYVDGMSDAGGGIGAGNSYFSPDDESLRGKVYGYYFRMFDDSELLDEDETIDADVEEDRWKLAARHYQEIWDNLTLTGDVQALSDENYNDDFDDEERLKGWSTYDLENDRASYANLANRYENFNLRVLYQERLHDFHRTGLSDIERRPSVVADVKDHRIFDSPVFWEALLQYDHEMRQEIETDLRRNIGMGVDDGDTFTQSANTNRLHGESIFSVPIPVHDYFRVIPRTGYRGNLYADTARGYDLMDRHGPNDSSVTHLYDSLEQHALQAGVEVDSRMIFGPSSVNWGSFGDMRAVIEPNLAFDYFAASEDLRGTVFDDSRGDGILVDELGTFTLVDKSFPIFDANDVPLDDAQILSVRLDSKLQDRGAYGKRNLIAHSLTFSQDYEPSHDGYTALDSDLFLYPNRGIVFNNFLRYDLNEDYLSRFANGGTLTVIPRTSLSIYHTGSRNHPDASFDQFVSNSIAYQLGDKYLLSLATRIDAGEGELADSALGITRDMHDILGSLIFRYSEEEFGDDEFEVRLVFELNYDRQRLALTPAEEVGFWGSPE